MIKLHSFDEETSTVVLESDYKDPAKAIAELRSVKAKRFAIKEVAKLGIRNAGVSGFVRVYPVDEKDKPISQRDVSEGSKVVSYRADIRVASSINI